MDSQTTIRTSKANSPQPPNLSETPVQHKSSSQINQTLLDISFSSYLKPKDLDPTPNTQECGTSCTPDDTEISIFDAHKYFNETNDPKDVKRQQPSHDSLSVPKLSSVSSVDRCCRNFQARSFHATPTSSSEASWNSQTGLLANLPGVFQIKSRSNKRISAAKKWFFGRKCCCNGKKSVQIKEVTANSDLRRPVVLINNEKTRRDYPHKEKEPQNLSQKSPIANDIVEIRQNQVILSPQNISTLHQSSQCRISASGRPFIDGPIGFTFPIVNPDKGIIKKSIIKPPQDPLMDNPAAKPISKPLEDQSMDNPIAKQIFEDPSMDNSVNRESPIARDDDTGSDASSDLFEIEGFSNQTTLYRRRDSLDEEPACDARRFASVNGIDNNIQCGEKSLEEPRPAASVAATQCYLPARNVSTTDFSVSATEIGGDAFLRQRLEEAGDDGGKKKLRNNGVILLNSRQEKAVGVGPPQGAEGPPMLSLKVGGRPPLANKPRLGSATHSAENRLSLAFAA